VPKGGRLVGNLPYYVSSPLMRRFLALRGRVRDLHVMLQEEVARRIASPPGSREYGILSVLYGLVGDVEIVARFPPGSFVPPPKVSSAVLRARFLDAPEPMWPTFRPSKPSSRGPFRGVEGPLKTTFKIAMLTSRIT
jgi:16S rRNA (adenine1518-N6/adenine1519-N6)-dimethyltransferase